MKRRAFAAWMFAASGAAQLALFAQQAPPLKPFSAEGEPPVRRAEPVPKPPAAPEKPAEEKPPAAKPAAKPFRNSPVQGPEIPDPTGEIRLAPTGTSMTADQLQMSIADGYYAKQMWEMAAPEYEKYLGLYPAGVDKPVALFRLAESYRRAGTLNAAKNTYETLLNQFSGGEFAGPASFRLADLYYQEKSYNSALPLFRKASVRLRDPKLIAMAKFYTGRTLEALGQRVDARMVYEDLVATPNDNPFLDASRLSLAILLKDGGRTAEALKHVEALAKSTENPDLKAEATVRSGLWHLELNQPKKAEENLQGALQMPNIGRWKDVAQIGLLQMKYNDGKYQEVVDQFGGGAKEISADSRPQFLVLVANSFRQLGKIPEALKLYDQLVQEAPSSIYAKDASYERLVCLYQTNSESLPKDIEQFLAANPESNKRDQVLLMKAEMLFKKPEYASAAPIYETVSRSKQLSGNYKAQALYKFAWCSLQTGATDKAVAGFTGLIDGYPTVDSLSSAYYYRAIAKLRSKDLPGAQKDLSTLISKYPKSKEREPALEQRAIIQGQLNDNNGMSETYQLLLKDFPNTPAAADANYWIGWVAFENKSYKDVPGPLGRARDLDKEKYFERASLRILLSHYYVENWEAVAREIDLYQTAGGKGQVPEQVLRGVGMHFYEVGDRSENADERKKNFGEAAKYLGQMCKRDEAKPDDFLNLGRSRLFLDDFKNAVEPLDKYLHESKEPAPRCVALINLSRAHLGLRDFDAAQKCVNEALPLQPEGRLNAEVRTLSGDIQAGRGNPEEAAKIYEAITVIIDEEEVTPPALEKAVEAYKKAGREADAKRLFNTLQSRYPEYVQRKKKGA